MSERNNENAASAPAQKDDLTNAPITVGVVLKWGGLLLTLASMAVSGFWYMANLKTDNMLLQQKITLMEARLNDKDQQLTLSIENLTSRTNSTEKSIADMGGKLERAVLLLERIDKKVGTP